MDVEGNIWSDDSVAADAGGLRPSARTCGTPQLYLWDFVIGIEPSCTHSDVVN